MRWMKFLQRAKLRLFCLSLSLSSFFFFLFFFCSVYNMSATFVSVQMQYLVWLSTNSQRLIIDSEFAKFLERQVKEQHNKYNIWLIRIHIHWKKLLLQELSHLLATTNTMLGCFKNCAPVCNFYEAYDFFHIFKDSRSGVC